MLELCTVGNVGSTSFLRRKGCARDGYLSSITVRCLSIVISRSCIVSILYDSSQIRVAYLSQWEWASNRGTT